ncbi:MAG: EamA family transporter [Cyanobacteriota bacterium]|jgi:transporter family protein
MPWTELAGRWSFWAGLASLFAALTAVLAKLGVSGLDSNLATWLRTLVVAVMLTVLMVTSGQLRGDPVAGLAGLPTRSIVALVLSGIATGLSWLCYFRALQMGPVAQVAAIDKLSVVLVALFGVAILGEALAPMAWAGILLMGGGAALVALA